MPMMFAGKLNLNSGNKQQILDMIYFMALTPAPTSKPLILNRKHGLATIEWE
jgi:hypothetical protein